MNILTFDQSCLADLIIKKCSLIYALFLHGGNEMKQLGRKMHKKDFFLNPLGTVYTEEIKGERIFKTCSFSYASLNSRLMLHSELCSLKNDL